MPKWVRVPREHGWYWHRFYVSGRPVFNLCCVSIVGERVQVHYLGELDQQTFHANDTDMFWGPLTPPP
jgi:hypothetical protein